VAGSALLRIKTCLLQRLRRKRGGRRIIKETEREMGKETGKETEKEKEKGKRKMYALLVPEVPGKVWLLQFSTVFVLSWSGGIQYDITYFLSVPAAAAEIAADAMGSPKTGSKLEGLNV
jgi:hypothetical protein